MSDQPNADGGENPNGSPGAGLTEEAIRTIANQAVSSQLKRALSAEKLSAAVAPLLETKLGEFTTSFGESFQKELSPLKEFLSAQQKAAKEREQQQKPAQTQEWEQRMAEQQAAFEARLKEQQAENEKQIKLLKEQQLAAQRAAADERKKAAETRGYSALKDALVPHLNPDAVPAVVDILRARGQVLIDDEGNPRLRVRAALEKGMPEEDLELPVTEALPHWLKTKEAAFFVPPPTQGGAGKGGNGRPPAGSNGAGNGAGHPPKRPGDGDVSDAFEKRFGKSLDSLI